MCMAMILEALCESFITIGTFIIGVSLITLEAYLVL